MNYEKYMDIALEQAQIGAEKGEVPVGALILTSEGEIISKAYNLRESTQDPLGHAEMLAIKKAATHLNSWRLTDCSIFVTLEPCMMCAGAIWQSRLKTVVFGASDPKGGFLGSLCDPFNEFEELNHRPQIISGVRKAECGKLLTDFFKTRRSK